MGLKKIHKDWRLPTIQELLTLVDYNKYNPAYMDNTMASYGYWSSTSYVSHTGYAWVVKFGNGSFDYSCKEKYYYVRCVRTSKSGKLHWSKTNEELMNWKKAIKYAKKLKSRTHYKA